MNSERSQPPDQASRDRIANELRQTLLVEAAAGTGKTTCLINRMVGLLKHGECEIETLAAVTFTRKAAAELRTRFQLAVEKALRESSGVPRQRLNGALAQIERCFIGTIHSFCARLLRERPVEARVDPGFVELDEDLDHQLRQQAWREHVARLITTDDAMLPELEQLGLKITPATRRSSTATTELDELGLEVAELGQAFMTFAEYSDVNEWPAEPVPLPDLQACTRELTQYAAHMRSLNLLDDPGRDKLIPKYNRIGRMAPGLELTQPAQLMELLEEFEGSVSVVQRQWPGKKAQALTERDRWTEFVEQYASPMLLAWRQHRYQPVMKIIRPALEIYDQLRRERNALNFQDLLLRSVALLRDKPGVRRYFRSRFTHLLVDEFQDTDPIQAEVMLLLTADDCGQSNWADCRPAPGSLFVVGDPKQSIYRFRRADIMTYNKVREIIEGVGQVIPLTANFRSIRPVVQWVNSVFDAVFPVSADDYSPANRPLEVGRADECDEATAIERLLIPAEIRSQSDVAAYEADMIARTIRRAIDEQWPVHRAAGECQRGLPDHAVAGDFLIVARRKTNLTTYARKLQQFGIPHSVTGGSALNQVPELELLHTCLTAVSRADDPIALVAVLRSELFGVADTLLFNFRRAGGQFSYNAAIPADLSCDEAAPLRMAFERLKAYSHWLRKLPAAAAIERIASDLGLIARACASEEGNSHAGSLLKAIEILREAEGVLSTGDYVDVLARLVEQHEPHDGVSVRPSRHTPVRVMNLHQCKGLEAPIVFLVDPSGVSGHPVNIHINRATDRPRGFLPIYGPKRSQWTPPPVLAQPPGWSDLAALEQRFLDAEAERLLYVAATRAGTKLIISQRTDAKNNKNPWQRFNGHLQTAATFQDPGNVTSKPAAAVAVDEDQWNAETANIEQRWQSVVQPSYALRAIKQSAIGPGPKPRSTEQGGAQWGDVLHTLLEAAMNDPQANLNSLALSALESEELPLSLTGEAVDTVQRVTRSSLWRRAQVQRPCLTEVPLSLPLDASESEAGVPTILRGVIDLVFRESQGWVIVDYKSERVSETDIPALTTFYQPQVLAYAEIWQEIVQEPVIEQGLLFTHTGKYVIVSS